MEIHVKIIFSLFVFLYTISSYSYTKLTHFAVSGIIINDVTY